MKWIGAIVLFLGLAAPAAMALPQAPVQLAEVEGRYLKGIAEQVDELGRLRADALRRNDGIAASCVEQRLMPAQTLKAAASKAASRLRALQLGDIEAVNGEVRNLSTAATRVGELTSEARTCLRINSGQVVRNVHMTPDAGFEPARAKDDEHLADLIVPRRPAATPAD
jgi:hypothetical protein